MKAFSHEFVVTALPDMSVEEAVLLNELVEQEAPDVVLRIDGSNGKAVSFLEGMRYKVEWIIYLFGVERRRHAGMQRLLHDLFFTNPTEPQFIHEGFY